MGCRYRGTTSPVCIVVIDRLLLVCHVSRVMVYPVHILTALGVGEVLRPIERVESRGSIELDSLDFVRIHACHWLRLNESSRTFVTVDILETRL